MEERVYLMTEFKNRKSGIPKATSLAYVKSKRNIASTKCRHLERESFVQMTDCRESLA